VFVRLSTRRHVFEAGNLWIRQPLHTLLTAFWFQNLKRAKAGAVIEPSIRLSLMLVTAT
jgi:hypothetical protein